MRKVLRSMRLGSWSRPEPLLLLIIASFDYCSFSWHEYSPPKNGSKGKIRKTTIGEILERAAAVADPRRSIPCRLGLPRRPLSAGEDDISFAFISTEGALRRPMTCDDHLNQMVRSIPIPKPIAQQRPEDCRRPRTTSNEVRWNMLN